MRNILLEVGDGPEGIIIYTDDKGVIDWTSTFPAVYVEISIWGSIISMWAIYFRFNL